MCRQTGAARRDSGVYFCPLCLAVGAHWRQHKREADPQRLQIPFVSEQSLIQMPFVSEQSLVQIPFFSEQSLVQIPFVNE